MSNKLKNNASDVDASTPGISLNAGPGVGIQLPKALADITSATAFPSLQHQWNTSEEIASILIAFSQHSKWQHKALSIRPPSGSQMLYNRNCVRYRKDGYCWKKRKDGKTIRQDHMKLKVQGVECIYGSYVHSSILPTFHRRCYWLLQNPDVVLVHYLNVPCSDNNKITLPSVGHCLDGTQWTSDGLAQELTPMLALAPDSGSVELQSSQSLTTIVEVITQHILDQQEINNRNNRIEYCGTKCKRNCTNPGHQKPEGNNTSRSVHSRLVSLLQRNSQQRMTAVQASGVSVATAPNLNNMLITHQPANINTVRAGTSTTSNTQSQPLILSVTNMHGNNELIIVSGQTTTPISLITTATPIAQQALVKVTPNPELHIAEKVQDKAQIVERDMEMYSTDSKLNSGQSVTSTTDRTPQQQQQQQQQHITPIVQQNKSDFAKGLESSSFIISQPFSYSSIPVCGLVENNNNKNIARNLSAYSTPGMSIDIPKAMETDATISPPPSCVSELKPSDPRYSMVSGSYEKHDDHMNIIPPSDLSLDALDLLDFAEMDKLYRSGMQSPLNPLHSDDLSTTMTTPPPPPLSNHDESIAMIPCSSSLSNQDFELQQQQQQQQQSEENDIASDIKLRKNLNILQAQNNAHSAKQEVLSPTTCTQNKQQQQQPQQQMEVQQTEQQHPAENVENQTFPFHPSSFCTLSTSSIAADSGMGSTVTRSCPITPSTPTSSTSFPTLHSILLRMQQQQQQHGSLAKPSNVITIPTTSNVVTMTPTGPLQGSSSTDALDNKRQNFATSMNLSQTLVTISDFSPDWSYAEGNTKVLVAGPWYSTTANYSCLFNGKLLPAQLVQPGVLRCFSPAHCAGLVTLQVACDSYIISNTVVFEYKNREVREHRLEQQNDWLSVDDSQLQLMILNKLECVEKCLAPTVISMSKIDTKCTDPEMQLVNILSVLSQSSWLSMQNMDVSDSRGITLLHLSAGLGYSRLVTALIQWRCNNSSSVLETEVSPQAVDDSGWTPMVWACGRGKADVAVLLYHCSPSVLSIAAGDGLLPLSIARQRGHHILAGHIEQLELEQVKKESANDVSSQLNADVSPCLNTQSPATVTATSSHFSLVSQQVSNTNQTSSCSPIDDCTVLSGSNITSDIYVPNSYPFLNRGLLTRSASGSGGSSPLHLSSLENSINLPHLSPVIQQQQSNPNTEAHSASKRKNSFSSLSSLEHFESSNPMAHDESLSDGTIQNQKFGPLKVDIPISPPPSSSTPIMLTSIPKPASTVPRRLSEQSTTSNLRRRFNKRLSMEIFPCDSSAMDTLNDMKEDIGHSMRITNSEPDLGANLTALADVTWSPEALHSMMHTDLLSDYWLGCNKLGGSDDVFAPVSGDIHSSTHDVAMETEENTSVRSDSPYIDVEKVSDDDEDELQRQSAPVSGENPPDSGENQMVTLANQIIAAMPERIKLSPGRFDEGVGCDSDLYRDRTESHSSVTSQGSPRASSYGDDSGISTPHMGDTLNFEEYRYQDLGTPASSQSPESTCMPSPYSPYSPYGFQLDSPPPTAAEFTEYFNAPAIFMEKDFSKLTLSDHEQRKLYEAAKVIQNAYRHYRDKQQQQQQQRQKEIEAAILIQSYYRRYKQYIFYRTMTHAAVLIQSQFRSYYAQKRYKQSRDAAVLIQNQYRTYKQHERFKKSRNAAVIIQQRFRNHYQRKQNQEVASQLIQMASESNDKCHAGRLNSTSSHCCTQPNNSISSSSSTRNSTVSTTSTHTTPSSNGASICPHRDTTPLQETLTHNGNSIDSTSDVDQLIGFNNDTEYSTE